MPDAARHEPILFLKTQMRGTWRPMSAVAEVQLVNRFDGSQRMLVNRKMVVEIMLNQETDAADFRD
jgi:hypothetical protein